MKNAVEEHVSLACCIQLLLLEVVLFAEQDNKF